MDALSWPSTVPADPTFRASLARASLARASLARASWWARAGAFFIDVLIAWTPLVAAGAVLRFGPKRIERCSLDASGNVVPSGDRVRVGLCEVPTGPSIGAAIVLVVAAVGLWLALVVREGRTGRTPGKAAMGLATVDRHTGTPIGVGRNLTRQVVRTLLAAPFLLFVGAMLDHLWPLWDERGQALHDKAADAVVTTTTAVTERSM